MGKDKGKDKRPEPCPTRNGQGGWWETGNSTLTKPPKRWIVCRRCSGSGHR